MTGRIGAQLIRCVTELGGVAHRRMLAAHGFDEGQLREVVAQGLVERVRRDWFAVPECPEPLRAAVRIGARLSCVSLARLRGLWVVDRRLHVAVSRTASRLGTGACVHWSRSPVAGIRAYDALPDALALVAGCQRLDHAVAVFDSALNTGSVTKHELDECAERSAATRRLLRYVDGRADSGLESIVRVRLARLGIEMVPQVHLDGHPVDGLIGDSIVIQCDGYGPHSDRDQRNRDLAQDIRLRRLGYVVLRFSYDQIMGQWEWVLQQILWAIDRRATSPGSP